MKVHIARVERVVWVCVVHDTVSLDPAGESHCAVFANENHSRCVPGTVTYFLNVSLSDAGSRGLFGSTTRAVSESPSTPNTNTVSDAPFFDFYDS